MPADPEKAHGDWRIPDELWERMVPLLPPRKPHLCIPKTDNEAYVSWSAFATAEKG
jgi:hypothetical protein